MRSFNFVCLVLISILCFGNVAFANASINSLGKYADESGGNLDLGIVQPGDLIEGLEATLLCVGCLEEDVINIDFQLNGYGFLPQTAIQVGDWLIIDESSAYISSQEPSLPISFSIQIPEDITPGDYALLFKAVSATDNVSEGGMSVQVAVAINVTFEVLGDVSYSSSLNSVLLDDEEIDKGNLKLVFGYSNDSNINLNFDYDLVATLNGEVFFEELNKDLGKCNAFLSCTHQENLNVDLGMMDEVSLVLDLYYFDLDGERIFVNSAEAEITYYPSYLKWVIIASVVFLLLIFILFFMFMKLKKKKN